MIWPCVTAERSAIFVLSHVIVLDRRFPIPPKVLQKPLACVFRYLFQRAWLFK